MIHISRFNVISIFVAAFFSVLLALPTFLPVSVTEKFPSWLPAKHINLGLDLQGGSYLLLQLDTSTLKNDTLQEVQNTLQDTIRLQNLKGVVTQPQEGVFLVATDTTALEVLRSKSGLEGVWEETPQGIQLTLDEKILEEAAKRGLERSLEIIRLRLDETGTKEPLIQQQGADKILVQLPGVNDPQRLKQLLGKTAKLSFNLVNEQVGVVLDAKTAVPLNTVVMPVQQEEAATSQQGYLPVLRRAMVSGETLTDSQATFQEGQPVVSFRFNTVGAQKFGRATSENVGKRFAIVLDKEVISAPVIREAILGGSGIISGNFTTEAAKDLALLLRSGALPAPLTVIEERTVGAGLGADSITAGKAASIIGLIAVAVYMIVLYGRFGWYSVIALVLNLLMIIATMTLLDATLTLPGIAGIVLTIGMAVDANVIIFERMREEYRRQATLLQAIDVGFKEASTTIADANITTLIAAFALFVFGTGPIKGFAVTLTIGIVTSVYTAIVVTRWLVILWLKTKPKTLPMAARV
jgi:preprotein translocase subunit SecD